MRRADHIGAVLSFCPPMVRPWRGWRLSSRRRSDYVGISSWRILGGDFAQSYRSTLADARRGRGKYLDGDFRVVRPGAFVRCAVTGVAIPLEELRYWSVDLQEAYATPEAVLQRHAAAYARKS